MIGTSEPGRLRNMSIKLVLVVMAGLLIAAWIDGGEEPLRPISEPVELPEER